MKFKTNISKKDGHSHMIRGENLIDLIEKKSFVDVLFLLWRGDFPTREERYFGATAITTLFRSKSEK